jgi:hypothetical protein
MPLTRIKLTAIADGGITAAKLANPLNLSSLDVTLPQGVGGTNWTNAVVNQSSIGATGLGFEVASSNGYFVDTSSGTVTIKLPSSPTIGNYVSLVDYAGTNSRTEIDNENGYYTNRIQINPNGSKINGSTDYKDIGASRGGVQLVYVDSTQGWIVTDAANENTVKALLPSTPRINVGGILNSASEAWFQTAGDTITVNGTGFMEGVSVVLIDTIGSTEYTADNVVYVSSNQITFNIPAGVITSGQTPGEDPFDVKILNSNGSFVINSDALEYAPTPTFQTSNASPLGLVTATTNDPNADAFADLGVTISAISLDPDDGAVTYAITTLPTELTGLTINSATGALEGGIPTNGFPADDTSTGYTFTVTASVVSDQTSITRTSTRDFVITLEGNVSAPTVTSVDQDYISQSGTEITVTGTGFKDAPTVTLLAPDVNSTSYDALSVTFVSATQIRFQTTAAMATAIETLGQDSGDERFDLKVTNPVSGYSKEDTLADTFEYAPTPTFNEASGSVGSLITAASQDYSTLTTTTLDANPVDPDDTITYSLTNVATELANLAIDENTGALSGTADLSAVTPADYNFTVVAAARSAETDNVKTDNRVYTVTVAPASFYSYSVDQSLRFDGTSSCLSRTPTAGNQKTWTWSSWVKRSALATRQQLFSAYNPSNSLYIEFVNSTDTLRIIEGNSSGTHLATTQVFRDLSAWYHVVVAWDTTQATQSNSVKMYLNGSQITSFGTSTYPNPNLDGDINNNILHTIGCYAGSGFFFNGYLANIQFIDGAALDESYFGETKQGIWIPKVYDGTSPTGPTITDSDTQGTGTGIYGTNGFHLDFSPASIVYNGTTITTVNDVSGRGNHWAAD